MKETTLKLLPGLLMLTAAIVLMAGATFVTRPTTGPGYVLSALGIMFLCMGTMSLLRARRRK